MAKSKLQKLIEEAGKYYRTFKAAEAVLQQDKSNYAARQQLEAIVQSLTPAVPAGETLNGADHIINNALVKYNVKTRDKLNAAVDGNFKKVLGMLSRDGLVDLVLGVAPQDVKDKQYEEFRKAHEKYIAMEVAAETGNTKVYIDTVETKEEREYLESVVSSAKSGGRMEIVTEHMKKYANILRKEAEDKLKGKSAEYIKGYLTRTYSKAKDKYKKEMNIAAGSLVKSK